MSSDFVPTLAAAAARLYRPAAGPFAYYFALGKLKGDPVFREVLRLGLLAARPSSRLLDLGCGQGLLAAWLIAARQFAAQGTWPAGWSAPPQLEHFRGIELGGRDASRATHAFAPWRDTVAIEHGDITRSAFGRADVVTILDVLHYLPPAAQDDVLQRVRHALAPGGRLLLRVGDAGAGLRFRISAAVDLAVCLLRGRPSPRLYARPLAEWIDKLEALGFKVRHQSMNGDKPFANVMLIADLPH